MSSGTTSQSSTKSQAISRSPSLTPSQSRSASSSPTLSQMCSGSRSQSPSPSVSRPPYYVFATSSLSIDEAGPLPPLVDLYLSDALAPAVLELWLSRCPTDSGGRITAALECLASPLGPTIPTALNDSQSQGLQLVSLFSSQSSKTISVDCDPRSASPVFLGITNTVGAYFETGTGEGSFSCRLTSDSPRSLQDTRLQLPLRVQQALWPIWDDAIIVLPNGLMRSARRGSVRNGTAALLFYALNTSIQGAFGNSSAVLQATRALWDGAVPIHPAAATGAFSVTLTGASLLVLRSSRRTFSFDMRVSLGLGACSVLAVSDDRSWALLQTPPTSAACDNPQHIFSTSSPSPVLGGDCGYVSFVINTTIALACPPFCAGIVHAPTSVPVADVSNIRFVLGSLPTAESGLLPQMLSDQSSVDSSTGFYYAQACSAAGKCTLMHTNLSMYASTYIHALS
jgi:hypothetical protein